MSTYKVIQNDKDYCVFDLLTTQILEEAMEYAIKEAEILYENTKNYQQKNLQNDALLIKSIEVYKCNEKDGSL